MYTDVNNEAISNASAYARTTASVSFMLISRSTITLLKAENSKAAARSRRDSRLKEH